MLLNYALNLRENAVCDVLGASCVQCDADVLDLVVVADAKTATACVLISCIHYSVFMCISLLLHPI